MVALLVAFAVAVSPRLDAPFTSAAAVTAVTRDEAVAGLKTATVADAVAALTTYRVVTYGQYLIYAHQPGATGTATVQGRGACEWEVEPGYAAVVTLPQGGHVYLLSPTLNIPARKDAKAKPAKIA